MSTYNTTREVVAICIAPSSSHISSYSSYIANFSCQLCMHALMYIYLCVWLVIKLN